MAKKKRAVKKKTVAKKKPAPKKKAAAKKKAATKKKAVARKKRARRTKSFARGRQQTIFPITGIGRRGLDLASGGQSGDTQGLSRREDEDSESVEELAKEGQFFEAEAVSGVEEAKNPDESEVTTKEVPEDDVPPEYRGRD